jgi:hypothetical protein
MDDDDFMQDSEQEEYTRYFQQVILTATDYTQLRL